MVADADVPDALVAAFDAITGVISVYLFGSLAAGRAHRESDVDVGVLLDQLVFRTASNRFDMRLRLVGRLHAALGRAVDVVILNDTPPHFGRHIMTAGRRLILRDTQRDHAHLCVTLSRAADLEPFLRRTRRVKLRALIR